ncbi:hypothetical protein GCM10020000_37260 [Streptomyces olivoverticillatus]
MEAPVVHRPDPRGDVWHGDDDETQTIQSPVAHKPDPHDAVPHGAEDETALLPPVRGAEDETALLPPVRGAEDETALLPPVRDAEDETAVLPPVRGAASAARPADQRVTWGMEPQQAEEGRADAEETAVLPKPPVRPENPADRVPTWLFRPEDEGGKDTARPAQGGESERTRELPKIQAEADASSEPDDARSGRRSRRRPEWADDAPTLADELLGGRDRRGGRDARDPREARGDEGRDRS